jgi:glycosyltransferase involved in cell wall biosynthesis
VKVLHVITGLELGGTEGVLYRLIAASPPDIEHVVVSLRSEGHYGPRLRQRGISVIPLDGPRGRVSLKSMLALGRLIAKVQPDVVQTWMYHADLVGGLMARWSGVRSVVWGVRNYSLDPERTTFSARAAARACATLSRFVPSRIVCCSKEAAHAHQRIGYQARKFSVIPNGFDLSRFVPDAGARTSLRLEWGIGADETLVGMVARWDPLKDHANLLGALGILVKQGAAFKCALVGTDMTAENTHLSGLLSRLSLRNTVLLAGPRDDVPAVMNALDLHILSSAGEAFPNVVAEAMACGTPCVVTDVGDSAHIVGSNGWVVPPRDPRALALGIAEALKGLASTGRADLGARCRARIEDNFSLDRMVSEYRTLWMQVSGA